MVIITIVVVVVLLASFSGYEYHTIPHSVNVIPREEAYRLIRNNTDSTNATVNLSYMGSKESVTVGMDSEKILNPTIEVYIPVLAITTSQKINFPLTGLTFVINSVDLNYNKSNCSLSPVGVTYTNSDVQYIYHYSYDLLGNFTLTYYVHIIPIAEIGIFHLEGNPITASVTINVSVQNISPAIGHGN